MSTKRVQKESKFAKYMKVPIRILARARDFYVQSLSGCAAGQVAYGHMGCPTALPRDFSANSSYSDYSNRDEDLRELIRIASTRSLTGKIEAELLRSKKATPLGGGMPRSRTVTIGRIDEEKPCEFGGDDDEERVEVYPRSKSYEASR
ncbi:hypothetical protein BUALT_Bualt11G0066700 [Buddleja alternifolia]|uniref:Uncharacterized protein n=1 Tax=Buddleja alternifolia TaxID=168488 RepID=A0AAV6X062_9LAMI|nr:hypothetical protein BUALT_Bualt11G0066700 [Buddleja alternifolia]